jgi:hypothetical protein
MRMIAELSRRDNLLMIQIAKDSRAVALASAQDSATMRVIAGVTVLFLPATFAAVSLPTVLTMRSLTFREDLFLHDILQFLQQRETTSVTLAVDLRSCDDPPYHHDPNDLGRYF